MAESSVPSEDQMSSLTASLNEILKFESSVPGRSAPRDPCEVDGNQPRRLVLGSTLAVSQFSLVAVPQPCDEGSSPPTTILYLNGDAGALIESQGCSEADSRIPLMETIQWSLLNDKFPPDNISRLRDPSIGNMFLVKFWANMEFRVEESVLFQVATTLESSEMMAVSCKTSVCSFGRSIGDKIDNLSIYSSSATHVVYQNVHQLCDLLQGFVQKLKGCEHLATMNSVLENFSVLQVYTNERTQEMLLCLAYLFEVCPPEISATTGAMCKVFRLEASSSN